MNEFEKISREFVMRDQARKSEDEEKKREMRKLQLLDQREIRLADHNFSIVKHRVISLLKDVDKTVFGGKQEVIQWHKETPPIKYELDEYPEGYYTRTWTKTAFVECGLFLPGNMDNIVIWRKLFHKTANKKPGLLTPWTIHHIEKSIDVSLDDPGRPTGGASLLDSPDKIVVEVEKGIINALNMWLQRQR